MSYLNFVTVSTCHGHGTQKLVEGILNGCGPQSRLNDSESPFFSKNDSFPSALEMVRSELAVQITEMKNQGLPERGRWGVILASTKGIIDDLIWNTEDYNFDTFTPILDEIKAIFPFPIERSLTVSNACTSSHAAIEMAQSWLRRNWVDHVFIFGFDKIGTFTLGGFQTLKALSHDSVVRPFDKNRNGLLLGDSSASCVISREPSRDSFIVGPVQGICEGVSATRPDISGINLKDCYQKACPETPDLVIAHGTGTFYNDATESKAIFQAFPDSRNIRVTCSKWSVGHSLGASGLIDLGLATEIFKQKIIPGILTLQESDLEVSENLVRKTEKFDGDNILISSLGFGGTCSALNVRKAQ